MTSPTPILLSRLSAGLPLSIQECRELLTLDGEAIEHQAGALAQAHFGRKVYLRGLIEISNICRNNCYYCGLRRANSKLLRYRLHETEIMAACICGYVKGFRTFVLQGGEDPYWRGAKLEALVLHLRREFPDCAITLSMGEMEFEEYQRLFQAGANRYLLRHETIAPTHYRLLHPAEMSQTHRLMALLNLKTIGYQVGTGIMVGSPYQSLDHLADDLRFIAQFQPQMVGVGPFIPHIDTPFHAMLPGQLQLTLRFLALCRIACPKANIPATTAVATLSPRGRLQAILAGANVVMPNLTPPHVRSYYALYDHKATTGAEAAEGLAALEQQLNAIHYAICWDRGDYHDHSSIA